MELLRPIRETAEAIIHEIAQDKIKLVFDYDPNAGYAPDIRLNLNVDKLKSLGADIEVAGSIGIYEDREA